MSTTRGQDKTKANVGCGHWNFGPEWWNVDTKGYMKDHIDSESLLLSDLADESLSVIYASHFIAYCDDPFVFLKGWQKKLIKGGVLQIATPDFTQLCKCHLINHYPVERILGPLYGKMTISRNGEDEDIKHDTVYTFDSIARLLHEAGFDNIRQIKTGFYTEFKDQSWAYLPDRNYQDGTLISLNVECDKI